MHSRPPAVRTPRKRAGRYRTWSGGSGRSGRPLSRASAGTSSWTEKPCVSVTRRATRYCRPEPRAPSWATSAPARLAGRRSEVRRGLPVRRTRDRGHQYLGCGGGGSACGPWPRSTRGGRPSDNADQTYGHSRGAEYRKPSAVYHSFGRCGTMAGRDGLDALPAGRADYFKGDAEFRKRLLAYGMVANRQCGAQLAGASVDPKDFPRGEQGCLFTGHWSAVMH